MCAYKYCIRSLFEVLRAPSISQHNHSLAVAALQLKENDEQTKLHLKIHRTLNLRKQQQENFDQRNEREEKKHHTNYWQTKNSTREYLFFFCFRFVDDFYFSILFAFFAAIHLG